MQTGAHKATHSLSGSAARGGRTVLFGILASAVLAAVKVVSGVLGNAYALIADGVESMLDILSSLVVLGSLRIASQPPTERFQYGYGKAEPLGGMVVSIALLVAGMGIAIQSVREILTPHHLPDPFTLIVLVVVVATKEIMFRRLLAAGTSIGSRAMETDAWHHRSDGLTSAAAFVGISVALVAGEGYESADDWAALFACAIIGYNGIRLLRRSLEEILDVAPPVEFELRVRSITESVPGVKQAEKCNIRRSGLGLFVDLHVVVDGEISVRQGHATAHEVKDALMASDLSILDVVVHIEPETPPAES